MPLEWIKPGIVKPTDISEKEIQHVFETHLGDIEEGLQHVHSFVTIPVGFIDTLSIDSEGRPVIVEFKKPESSDKDALIQALDYYSWCKQNPAWLDGYIKKMKPDLIPHG